jgi:ABC-type branched-subunit amino acid transport system substrate-binding protein/streptogramin lyase
MKATFTPGTSFGGYRVDSLVGRGGMGVVYRATDLSLERPVALKLIAPELAEDERFRARFLREPRVAASLDHPNVIPIYEAGEHDGQLYLAMRFVEDSDLKSLLEREAKLPPERALAILAQVAGALDAAHRRGLVHRDVKPANVLLDEDGHVYLTDFGITKQLGGASTDTGRVVGTLDYLAPEQIRGEPVDGRTDCYALCCVLYECLAGAPPFRRGTEAETLWAHMQDPVPPLAGLPALDPVFRKALAKDPRDRYATCAELIADARAALAHPIVVPPRLLRLRHAILAAGVLVLAATAVAIVLSSRDGGGSAALRGQVLPSGDGLAAIRADAERITSFTGADGAPSNVAVGEGSVWVLNTADARVARVDPRTGDVIRSFEPGGRPTDIAAGAGAVWIGSGRGATQRVSRLDPATGERTRTVRLPGGGEERAGDDSAGFPGIAVGAGAVWAITPDETVSRLDPASGRRVAVVPATDDDVEAIAAGDVGVWVISGVNTIARIDPRTNRMREAIELGSNRLFGIAVGGGAVWATSEEGVLWRVVPGRPPIERTIEVGAGARYVAFGDGAVWVANWNDSTVSRVDPASEQVARVPVGAAQALAAGAGSAWVSVAGGSRSGVLPASACGELVAGGGRPDVLIASDLSLREDLGVTPAMVDAIRFVLQDHGFRAGEHTVGYRSCDDSTAQSGGFEYRRCAANANAFAAADRLVAVIGPFYSVCAQLMIPILNRAKGGPLALVGPTTTFPNLTRGGAFALPAPFGYRGEPDVYYPTGERNFVRLSGRGDLAGVALARLAKSLGLRSVHLIHGDPSAAVLNTDGFERAAPELGVHVAGVTEIGLKPWDAIAAAVERSGADGVVLGTGLCCGGGDLIEALRKRLGDRVTLLAGDGFLEPDTLRALGRPADGLYVVSPGLSPSAPDLTPTAQRFVREFGARADEIYVLEAAQATETVLAAIARSDGTRASVLKELQNTHEQDSILGDFTFDPHGDITPAPFTVLQVTGTRARPANNLIVDRVIAVPTD